MKNNPSNVKEACGVSERLPELGISIDGVTRQREGEGVETGRNGARKR